ncbi:MAG: ABC transporter ATP-binding protein [Elusimicrobia bacterium]|nr:ABC transporter ATP-binding protein [Candidatus Obscuribacterium magneticum]
MNLPSVSIELNNVKKRLGPNQALDGITTFFDAGLLHGIIGPDGAGKTTLLRTLMGLLHPDEGRVAFFTDAIETPFTELRSSMAYMPQQQSLYPDLSIIEHLDFFRDLYQIPKDIYQKKTAELLYITRLDKFQARPAGQLSGGMYKKLGLMCALLQSPSLLLLDEPTTGVDPISRREFWDLLYRLLNQKILILMTTATMDEAERCGRVHLLDNGRILAEGEPRSLLEREGVEKFEDLFMRTESLSSFRRKPESRY